MSAATNETNSGAGEWRLPAYDITEDKDSFYVHLDMPGVSQDRLEGEYRDKEIAVFGELDNSRFEACKLSWQEFRPYGFRRKFAVPEYIDVNGIKAQMKDGVVRLVLPKSEAVKPRRIAITSG